MTQELGKMERPPAEGFRDKRKLLLVPLLMQPPDSEADGKELLDSYWREARAQVESLEGRLGGAKHVYHETLSVGGDEGVKALSGEGQSQGLVQAKCQNGAALEATEDGETMLELLDLQRCSMLPFSSPKVAGRLQEWFVECLHRRNEHISKRIDETLGEGEVGLLLISERHQVQFPGDIEVFYVAPPSLDRYRRWMEGWAARQREAFEAQGEEAEAEGGGGEDGPG